MSEYWFARRYPKGHLRRSVAPVHPSGWMVVWAYLALMLLGGLGFLLLSQADRFTAGVVLFVAVSVVAGGGMIAIAASKTDPDKTLADYRKERQRAV